MKNQEQLLTSLLDKFKIDLVKSQRTMIKTLFVIMCGIIVKETVNLNKIKNQIGVITDKTNTQSNSHYRRLTRFFDNPFCRYFLWKIILECVIKQMIEHLDKRKLSQYLLMDGTSWEFGKINFHFLTLSIVYQGISIPIFFVNLSKKGTSNQQERKRFLQMANLIYPLKGMILIADREYVGRDWFIDLIEVFKLNFVIRLSETDYKTDLHKQGKSYGQMTRQARRGKIVEQSLQMGNHSLRMIMMKHKNPEKKDDDLIILMTNLKDKTKKIIKIYRLRWQIECLFKCLKTNGFCIENLGMKDPTKVRLLLCIVIACYVLCLKEGLKAFNQKLVGKAKVRKTRYESIFRKGYSLTCNYCQKIVFFVEYLILNFDRKGNIKPT